MWPQREWPLDHPICKAFEMQIRVPDLPIRNARGGTGNFKYGEWVGWGAAGGLRCEVEFDNQPLEKSHA